jgi:hypothetical protein
LTQATTESTTQGLSQTTHGKMAPEMAIMVWLLYRLHSGYWYKLMYECINLILHHNACKV